MDWIRKYIIFLPVAAFVGYLAFVIIWSLIQSTEQISLTYNNIPFPTNKKTYKAGEKLYINVDLCANRDTIYTVVTRATNKNGTDVYILDTFQAFARKGCMSYNAYPRKLPDNIKTGTYRIDNISVVAGKFKTYNIESYSQDFKVEGR